jgi:hypothetical protein
MSLLPNVAIFRSCRLSASKDPKFFPAPTQSVIPEWYKKASRFAKNPFNNEYWKATKENCPVAKEGTTDDYGLIPTWKACPAIMDAFSTGYVLKTPCDLTFFKNSNGIIEVKVEDIKYKDFCTSRPPIPEFEHPRGYYKHHFAWLADWGLELPEGYSALFMTPMNRFDLPFLNTTGVVDSDKVHMLGTFPFFIAEGWEGVIPAGTPYLQILPFKRENWEHEIKILEDSEIYNEMVKNRDFYRQPDGGVYKNKVWSRREYR